MNLDPQFQPGLSGNLQQPDNNFPILQNQPPISFLFCDHIAHENGTQSITNEIVFEKPVKLTQIRIVKGGSSIVPRFKFHLTTSLTQNDPIKSLEIFARDIINLSARYTTLVSANNLKELSSQDAIFVMPREVRNNAFLISSGHYKSFSCPGNIQKYHFADLWRTK